MEQLFDICVQILKWIAAETGLTYEEANIWIFVIIHPLLTLTFVLLYIREKLRNYKLKQNHKN